MAKNQEFKHLYNSKLWKQLRQVHLARNPLCTSCLVEGNTTPANVVNHVRPHRGDWALFSDPANLQSLCKYHHDSEAQSQDIRGYGTRIADDGWPTDTRHPVTIKRGEVRYIQPPILHKKKK
jgi:5-methylcytosine-specific restriction enzyme A